VRAELARLRAGLSADASDEAIMRIALAAARLSAHQGEVPVGAVLLQRGSSGGEGHLRWLSCTHNQPIARADPTAHAEILALRHAARVLGNYRLDGCELFVTLEPCAMCAQAMLHARLKRVVWGAAEPRTGAAGSVLNLFDIPTLNHQTQVRGGVLAQECSELMRDFFLQRREVQKAAAQPLRDDALRTPSQRFERALARWPDLAHSSSFFTQTDALDGLAFHVLDLGPAEAATVWLALHGPEGWWPQWADWAQARVAAGDRVLVPDLIGFGQSDKPKKPGWHTLARHVGVLLGWLKASGVQTVDLAVAPGQEALAARLAIATPERVRSSRVVADLPVLAPELSSAPFPDAGHRAGPKAWKHLTA
jgi:tRNA(Arg) A34 adenosine deaminase TadA